MNESTYRNCALKLHTPQSRLPEKPVESDFRKADLWLDRVVLAACGIALFTAVGYLILLLV